MSWKNWCVWAKYRTIVPKLGTPGKPCSSFQAAGQQRGANNRRNLPVLPRATADWAGHPERTIIRLPGYPRLKNEQLFGLAAKPDTHQLRKANNHSADCSFARISQFAARTKKPELRALAFVRSFTSFLCNDK